MAIIAIELIDVLWLQGDAIIAAFEVEHRKTIYYGLLRISNPASTQLNQDRPLRWPRASAATIASVIPLPTFARLKPLLPRICRLRPCSQDAAGDGADREAQISGRISEMKGFSPSNLKYMRKFFRVNQNETIVQEMLAQITWYHHITNLDKVKEPDARDF
ncbi:MAG: DUF1016 N-terminal domain-containing protein [Methanothrix sp.]